MVDQWRILIQASCNDYLLTECEVYAGKYLPEVFVRTSVWEKPRVNNFLF